MFRIVNRVLPSSGLRVLIPWKKSRKDLTKGAACARRLAMGESMPEQPQLFEVEEEAPLSRRDKKRKNYLTPVSPAIVLQVWETYLDTFSTGKKGAKPRLTDERTKLITVAVNMHGADTVKAAIRGCALSPWHMGQNPTGTLYNSIELILRDSPHIEKFAQLTVAYESGGGFLDDED